MLLDHIRLRVRRGIAGAIALAVALALSTAAVTASGAAVTSKKAKVDKSAVLRVGVPLNDQGGVFFDPSNSVLNPFARLWVDLIYDTMIHDTPDGKGAPGLATKWSTPDPQTVELTLRNAKFSDGSAFNSAAVKAAWERLLASSVTTIPSEIKAITSIETPDDHTVRVHLSEPLSKQWINETLRNSFWLGVPSPAAVQAGNVTTKPVGAGPYALDNYQEGQQVTLKRNPQFYDPRAQKLGGIEFIEVSTGAPALAALQGGTVDLIGNLATDALDKIKGQPGLALSSQPGTLVYDISLCTSEGPFASKKARQALQYAIDRKGINDAAFAGQGTPTILPLSPSHPFYNKALAKTYSYNPKKAKALFKQAGVKPGTTITALVPTGPPEPAISEIVQSELKDLGLKVQITPSTNVPADAGRLRPAMDFVGLDPTLFQFAFAPPVANALNACGWKNADVEAALNATKNASLSEGQVKAAWDKFQKLVLAESPVVFTDVAPLLAAHTDKVKGIDIIYNIIGPYLRDVYMVK